MVVFARADGRDGERGAKKRGKHKKPQEVLKEDPEETLQEQQQAEEPKEPEGAHEHKEFEEEQQPKDDPPKEQPEETEEPQKDAEANNEFLNVLFRLHGWGGRCERVDR